MDEDELRNDSEDDEQNEVEEVEYIGPDEGELVMCMVQRLLLTPKAEVAYQRHAPQGDVPVLTFLKQGALSMAKYAMSLLTVVARKT